MRGMSDHSSLLHRLGRFDRAGPVSLPRAVDRISEWWCARGPRTRALASLLAISGLVAALTIGMRPTDLGPSNSAWTTEVDLPMGTVLDGHLVRVERAVSALPVGAVTDETPPVGRLTSTLHAGQIVAAHHLTEDMSGLLGAGEVAVPVHRDQVAPVPIGVRVALLAVTLDGAGQRLSEGGRTIAGDGIWLWLAVPADVAGAVAAADSVGRLSLGRLPP